MLIFVVGWGWPIASRWHWTRIVRPESEEDHELARHRSSRQAPMPDAVLAMSQFPSWVAIIYSMSNLNIFDLLGSCNLHPLPSSSLDFSHTHIIGNYWWFTSKSPKSLHFFLNLRPNPLTDLEAGGLHARLVRLCRVRRSRRGGRGAEFGVAWDGAQGIAGTGEDWLQTYLQLGWCWDVGLDGETCKKHVYNLYSWCFEVIQLRYWWFIFG